MHTKKDASFLLTIVLSMLILAYITFITVYEQILSQNNGFFNVIIYGVVLILIFIFVTLFLRVITVKAEESESTFILNLLIVLGIIAVFAVFVVLRLRYTSSISPYESYLYKTASYISDGYLSQGSDVHNHIIEYPADFIYGLLLSNIFTALGTEEGIYVIVNISMMLIAALFLFLNVNLISTKANATLAILAFMFMPNTSSLCYSYNAELFVTAMFMIVVYIYELLIYKRFKSDSTGRILALLCGIFSGLLISSEPVLLIAIIVLMVWSIKAKRQSLFACILPVIFSIVEMLALTFLKAIMMGVGFVNVLLGQLRCFLPFHIRGLDAEKFSIKNMFIGITDRFNNPSRFLNDNSYFLMRENGKTISASQTLALSIVDQFIYLFMLILCVLCIVYIIRVSYDKIVPAISLFIAVFFCQVLGGDNQVSYIYFLTTIIIIGSTTLYYMFLNHHPEYAVYITNKEIRLENEMISEGIDESEEAIENGEEEAPVDILRARALIFFGENDDLYRQIKTEEKLNRASNSVAATRIKTVINEAGEYDSVEEDLEFFDEPDEKIEIKEVHEVKAIPATRPVEVVKPVLADEYFEEENKDSSYLANNSSFEKQVNPSQTVKPVEFNPIEPKPIETRPVDTGTVETNVVESKAVESAPAEGFVFRKKDDKVPKTVDNIGKIEPIKKESKFLKSDKAKKEKAIKEKPIKEKPLKEKNNKKSLSEIKPGEPLPNPLEGPKAPKKTGLSFDFDGTDTDDFDF